MTLKLLLTEGIIEVAFPQASCSVVFSGIC